MCELCLQLQPVFNPISLAEIHPKHKTKTAQKTPNMDLFQRLCRQAPKQQRCPQLISDQLMTSQSGHAPPGSSLSSRGQRPTGSFLFEQRLPGRRSTPERVEGSELSLAVILGGVGPEPSLLWTCRSDGHLTSTPVCEAMPTPLPRSYLWTSPEPERSYGSYHWRRGCCCTCPASSRNWSRQSPAGRRRCSRQRRLVGRCPR